MFAYVVTGAFPEYGSDKFRMLVYDSGDKHSARSLAENLGWVVKKISVASVDEIQDLGDYRKLLLWVKDECKKRATEKLRQDKLAEIARREAFQRQQAENQRREEAREEQRELAIATTIGDIVNCEPEPTIEGNANIAAICSKVSVFFNQAAVNKTDVYTSISLDYAQFQATQNSIPKTCRILQQIIEELNNFLAIEQTIADSLRRVDQERQSAEGKINAIGSRTHIFGGSGEGLLLSWLCAEGAASKDRKEMQGVGDRYTSLQQEVSQALRVAKQQQRLQELRAKTAVSVLLAATGLGEAISLNIPDDIEALADLRHQQPARRQYKYVR